MSDEKKVLMEALLEGSFFNAALDSATEAYKKAKSVEPDSSRTSGNTAIQAFLGHKDILLTATSPEKAANSNLLLLFENTNAFLKEIGKSFADADAETAKKIEEIEEN